MRFGIRFIRRIRGSEKRISINIADDLARKGRWIAWIVTPNSTGNRYRLYLNLRPLLILGGLFAVLSYFTAGFGLAWWLSRTPYNRVAAADLLLPWRWSEVRGLRGEGFAARGTAELAAGHLNQAIFFIQRGLDNQPDNAPARLAVAQVYARGNYYAGVGRILKPQLRYQAPRDLLELWFKQAVANDDFATINETTDLLLNRPENNILQKLWLVGWRANALVSLHEPQAALDLLDANPNGAPLSTATIRVNALVDLNRKVDALAFARTLPHPIPGEFPTGQHLIVLALRENGQFVEMKQVLTDLVRTYPLDFQQWIFAITELTRAGQIDDAQISLRDCLRRFGNRPDVVLELIEAIAATHNVPLAAQSLQLARELGYTSVNFAISTVACYVANADWPRVSAEFPKLFPDSTPTPLDSIPVRNWLRAVIATAKDPSDLSLLDSALSDQPMGIAALRSTAQGFARSENWLALKAIATTGIRSYPHSPSFQIWLAEATSHLAAQPSNSTDPHAAERLATQNSNTALFTTGTETAFFDELTRSEAKADWRQIDTLLRQVRRARPDWLSNVSPRLDQLEAKSAGAQGDLARLRQLAPAVLRRFPDEATWMADQAMTRAAAGETAGATSLLRTIVETLPGYEPAIQALERLATPAAPATAPTP